MSKQTLIVLGFVIGVVILIFVVVYADGQSSLTLTPGGLLTACGVPVANSKQLIFCNVANDPAHADGVYVSANGAAFFLVGTVAAPSGGVTSWKTRTGAVVPLVGDYKYSDLALPPTKINCAVASISAGATGKLDASNCTIN